MDSVLITFQCRHTFENSAGQSTDVPLSLGRLHFEGLKWGLCEPLLCPRACTPPALPSACAVRLRSLAYSLWGHVKPRLSLGLSRGHQSLSLHEGSTEPLAPRCPSLPCNESVPSCCFPQESQLQGQPFFSLRGSVPLHPPRAPGLSIMFFLTQNSLGPEELSGTTWRMETSPSPLRRSLFSQKPPS